MMHDRTYYPAEVSCPSYPIEMQIIAIDSTSFVLGEIPDGIVRAIRLSVIVKPKDCTQARLESDGPFLAAGLNH
jgi:hypothetical protein